MARRKGHLLHITCNGYAKPQDTENKIQGWIYENLAAVVRRKKLNKWFIIGIKNDCTPWYVVADFDSFKNAKKFKKERQKVSQFWYIVSEV